MSEAEDNDSGAETLEESDELDFIIDQIKKGGLKFLAGIDDNKPLVGPRSIKTKAKILPTPRMESPEDNRRRKNRKRSLMLEGYEVESRKASTWGDGSDSFRLLLPVKTKHGIVQQTTSAPEMPSSSSSESDEEYDPPTLPEDIDEEMLPKTAVQPTVQSQSTVELFISRQEKLAENKTLLATTANKILENPEENISLLKTLKVMCLEKDPQVVITTRKLAMISFAQVVKDIAPGYHIRTDGQEKTQVKLSKEVRRLRGFEQGLLSMYQQYLSILGETIDTGLAPKGASGKKRKKNLHISTLDSGVSLTEVALKGLGMVALNCLCDLLTTLPHFNFSTNILVVLVPLLDHKDRKVSDLCCKALCSVFEEDLVGEISLEAVKLVASMVKNRKYKIRPEALEVFCHLRLHNVDPPTADSQVLPQSKRAKKTKPKLSRQERKQQKALEKVEHELKETEAEESRSKKTKIQTEVLNQVFVTYFRILKHAPDSQLVSPAMRGLAKFAHLINVDFFADLMSIFSSLLASGTLSNEVSLNCVATALQILSGQGELLNIDPRQFYIKLYQSILELGSSNQDCIETALGCLDKAFKKRHQVSIQRIAAFLKRLSVVNLQLLPPASLAVMATIRSFMHGYPRCEMLLDMDTPTAVYQPELPDPDVCHADATNLWELSLVAKHYHPTVALYGKHLIKGASSQGPGSLPPHLSKKSVSELLKAYALSEEDPFVSVPLPPPHPADKATKKGKTYRYRDLPLQQNSLFLVGNSS